jgi:DNA polymerase III gamma/tau subunit
VFSAAAKGDRGAAVATLGKLLDAGEDPRRILKEFLSLLRRLLMLAAGAQADLSEADQTRLTALSRAMPYENLLRAVSLAIETDALARRADDAGLVLQMLVLKLAELPRLKSIEEALSRPLPQASPDAAPPSPRSEERGPRILSLVPVEPEPAAAPPPKTSRDAIARFHDLLDARRRVTGAQASLAESIEIQGEELVLRFGIDKAPAKEALEEPAVRKLLTEVAREAFGRPLRIVLKTGPPANGDLGQAAREVPREAISRSRASNRAEIDPVVRSAMELFRAELTEVKEEE